MRRSVSRPRHSLIAKSVLVLLAAGLSAGCSGTSTRFSEGPLFAASTSNQQEIFGPSTAVSANELAPPGSAASAVPSLAEATLPVSPPGTGERSWTSTGSSVVTVAPGETAATLSQRYGVPMNVLLAANRMSYPTEIQPGARIVIPTYVFTDNQIQTASQAAELSAQQSMAVATTTASTVADTYIVQPGDTAWSIARRFSVDIGALMATNQLPSDGSVRIGQTLVIPAKSGSTVIAASQNPADANGAQLANDAGAADAAPVQQPAVPEQGQQVASLEQPSNTMIDAPAAPDENIASVGGSSGDGATGFRWPARGRIIAGFGKQADGARNDGINLAVPAGTPVKAAENGTVIYAGNELQGYGNLILVQHENGWVSAYAHNETLLVTRGETVKRGQMISRAGATGSVSQPQIHFELRKGSKPVDPLPHLVDA